MIDRHTWDGDAIAAVISNESGFRPDAMNPLAGSTAVGLLQFIHSTLQNLGWTGTREEFAKLSDVEQLPFVERYFARALGDHLYRPVDYYLATWGAKPGLPLDHVLATQGDRLYLSNAVLDHDHDGKITVADLDAVVMGKITGARGVRLSPKVLAPTTAPDPAPPPRPNPPSPTAPSSPSSSSPPISTLPGVAEELATVRIWKGEDGARGFTLTVGQSMHSGPLADLTPWLDELGLLDGAT